MVEDSICDAQNFVRLLDPDVPIFRIFPLWCLEDSLRLKRITFVQPRVWDDPFEIIESLIAVNEPGIGQKIINQNLPPVFAQCWSTTPESDTLLRAYSRVDKDPRFKRNTCPRYEGVQVKSTPRKLLQVLRSQSLPIAGHAFAGAVQYMDRQQVYRWIHDTIVEHGLEAFQIPQNRAGLLLLKRLAFQHESEVRPLFVCSEVANTPFLHVAFDPNEVFDEVRFDPRLKGVEAKERANTIKSLGYRGTIARSDLYDMTMLEIHLNAAAKT
jgi:hypothetical protein